jgi:RimJ/RimL family protein N-acetyltransferase
MDIDFVKLAKPTSDIATAFSKWENDSALIPLIRPNPNEEALQNKESITIENLAERLEHNNIFLIYLDGQLIGEMDYQIDPNHLYKKEPGTAWIGIIIGEETGRGRGIGFQAIKYMEEQIKAQGLKRIELGVFEFNTSAIKLYQRLGYKEIARIKEFTFWDGKMRQDIRMEKYI